MSLTLSQVLAAAAIGVGASLLMDVWNLFLKRAFGIPSLNYCLLGRWLLHMPGGTFSHASITAAPKKHLECTAGWLAHYTIGVVFALVFVTVESGSWLAHPTLLPALIFGIVTVVFPLFIMQPALGLGVAASKTPRPAQARLKSLATHTVFGVGLYLSGLVANHLLPIGESKGPTFFSNPTTANAGRYAYSPAAWQRSIISKSTLAALSNGRWPSWLVASVRLPPRKAPILPQQPARPRPPACRTW